MSPVIRLVFLLLIMLKMMNTLAWGKVYKCPDGKGGYDLRDTSCVAQDANTPFDGRIVKVMDGQTLQVLRAGIPVIVKVRDVPLSISKDRIQKLVGQQTVTIIVYDRMADGRLISEVILPTGRSLSQEVKPPEMASPPDKSYRLLYPPLLHKRDLCLCHGQPSLPRPRLSRGVSLWNVNSPR